jgi:hypothetical protein
MLPRCHAPSTNYRPSHTRTHSPSHVAPPLPAPLLPFILNPTPARPAAPHLSDPVPPLPCSRATDAVVAVSLFGTIAPDRFDVFDKASPHSCALVTDTFLSLTSSCH